METRTGTPAIRRDTLKSEQLFRLDRNTLGPFEGARKGGPPAAYRRNFILQRGGVMARAGELGYQAVARVTLLPHLVPTPPAEYGATVPARALAER